MMTVTDNVKYIVVSGDISYNSFADHVISVRGEWNPIFSTAPRRGRLRSANLNCLTVLRC